MKLWRGFGSALVVLLALGTFAQAQTWTALKNKPAGGVGAMLLLLDGTVMVHSEQSNTGTWYKLTPDSTGSYINGTWSTLAAMPSGYAPLYFGSVVLNNGEVVVEGGEYNNGSASWTNMGAVYNPTLNKWKSVNPPSGWAQIGDAPSVILPNGTYMQGDCCDTPPKSALFNPSTLTWTTTGSGKFDIFDEEGMTLLPNGNVLDVDAYVFQYNSAGMNSEIYNTSAGTWATAGNTGVQLWDSSAKCGGSGAASYELGPAVLQPNGKVFATGANRCAAGHTSIYDPVAKTWTPGPDFSGTLDIADGPAALEINGNVLLMTSPGIFGTPTTFVEWNGTTLTTITGPSSAKNDSSFYGHFLELPSGQILLTDFSSNVNVFTPAGTYEASWQPTVTQLTSTTLTHGKTYTAKGTQFNGLSQGSAYGDDFQDATNYPLVRITNTGTGNVVYCKTSGFLGGVQTGSAIVSTRFTLPATIGTGASTLEVVANGIPSAPVSITVN